MRIKGKSVQSFLPIFLKHYAPSENYSQTATTTIFNILETIAVLGNQKINKKINVSDVVKKSGYSRTTYYSYFTDINQPLELIEEMVSYHMFINSNVYLSCFSGDLTKSDEDEVLGAIADFSPYINTLMAHSDGFKERYRDIFKNSFQHSFTINLTPKDERLVLEKTLYSALIYMLSEYIKGSEAFSLRSVLDVTKIIVQALTSNNKE